MPRTIIPVRFKPDEGTGYLMDIGNEIAANSKFVLPPDMTEANADAILVAIGAQNLANTGDPIPCTDNTGADLRRLQFIRSNGGSMSVPVSSRVDILNAAATIEALINGAGGAEVVCIKLMGEYFPNLADELGLDYQNTIAQSHVSEGESKQFYYTGTIQYASDNGKTIIQPIRSITDIEDTPATQIAGAWTGCVGNLETTLPCKGKGRRNPVAHRRYTLTLATKLNPGDTEGAVETETIELPVKSRDAAEIKTCGENAAASTGVYCIEYEGESNDRIKDLIG